MTKPRIYLDHAATTPIRPEAKAAMLAGLERWANPSSPHAEGRAARAALEDARERIKRALGWTGELIFTSGATEAIDIVMRRAKRPRRLVSPVEHDAVFRAAPDAELLPLADYSAQADVLEESLAGEPALVAVQHINSETGVILGASLGHPERCPVYNRVSASGGLLLCDCAQSGVFPASMTERGFPYPMADFLVFSSHKLGAPAGVGALLVRDLATLEAGGGQEHGYRGGTENLPAILGFAAAVEAAASDASVDDPDRVAAMFGFDAFALEHGDRQPGIHFSNSMTLTSRIVAVTMPHLRARAQLIRFDQAGFAVSAGSACSSGSLKPSRALKAFGVPDDEAERTIRVSFGWTTTVEDIHTFQNAWLEIAEDARRRAT